MVGLVAASFGVVGCGHSPKPARSALNTRTPASAATSAVAAPKLADEHACATDQTFTCASLTVPLDRTGQVPGNLRLPVEVQAGPLKPKGYLVFLSGGPGEYGASYAEGLSQRFPEVNRNYTWVSLDFRGTGAAGAPGCPSLQRQVGTDDLAIPTVAAVNQCAGMLGHDATLYSSTNTVADLDDLRRALGAQTWAMDGISYGTYYGERYVLAHPRNVSKLVLDSVVPHSGDEPLVQTPLHAFARVFHSICAERSCPSDPVADLHTILQHRTDAATVSDALLQAGIYDGKYVGVPEALDAAAHGQPAKLDQLIAARAKDAATSDPKILSQGTHASALCADIAWPWPADAGSAQRAARLRAMAAAMPASVFYPYTANDALGNGIAVTCEHWPSAPAPVVAKQLPPVPTLLLGGTHDLSCPIEWLQQEAAVTPNKQVHIFADTGHSQQTYNGDRAAIGVLTKFLDG